MKTWLAVHSLLMYQETESEDVPDLSERAADEVRRQERTRLAAIAAMVASQEVMTGIASEDEDDEAVS